MLTKKAKNYKNLITTNKLLTLNYVGSFYNWFIPLIITIDNQVLNIDELDLLRTYFDFYIKTLFLYKELLITDTELMIDLNKISIKIFTNNHIKNTSDSIYTIKLIAFKTYHLSKSLIINYEHQVIKNICNILINLYINCTKNPENTYCHILITYFYDNTQLLTSDLIESVDIDKIENFTLLLLRDINNSSETVYSKLNNIIEYYQDNYKYNDIDNENDTDNENLEFIDILTKKINVITTTLYEKINVLQFLVKTLPTRVKDNIISNLVRTIIFYGKYIYDYYKNVNKNYYNIKNIVKSQKSIAKIILYYNEDPVFYKECINDTNEIQVKHFKLLFKNSNLYYNKQYITFINKLEKSLNENKLNIIYTDDFLDPLLYVPIVDPVILPNTYTLMDKSVILRQLLEIEENPFDRTKLTKIELLEFNDQLSIKEKVSTFLKNKLMYEKNYKEKEDEDKDKDEDKDEDEKEDKDEDEDINSTNESDIYLDINVNDISDSDLNSDYNTANDSDTILIHDENEENGENGGNE
jgi:hypothetical protein